MTLLSKHIVLFEPWGLGDLAVSLSGLRCLTEQGCALSVICDPAWVGWVQSFPWVTNVISFHVPWTEKRGKYNPVKYKIDEIWQLRQKLLTAEPDVVCETRGDIRNELFLRMLLSAPVVTLRNKHFCNRYDYSSELVKTLGYSASNKKAVRTGGGGVVCFFGAAWVNRCVPTVKAHEIIKGLLDALPCSVSVILQPNDAIDEWSEMMRMAAGRLLLIKASIVQAVSQISSADVAVCTDSSWLHLAHVQGIPTVGLFGFTNAVEWAPPGCRVVHSEQIYPAEDRYCLKNEMIQPLGSLDASLVISQVRGLLNANDFSTNKN